MLNVGTNGFALCLRRWVMASHTDPMTNLPLDESQLTPAFSLRNAIQEYLEHMKKTEEKKETDP